MPDIRVSKVTVGSPTYKSVVGDVTRVRKVVIGVPTSTVLISNSTNLNDVVGITTSGITKGDLLVADSDGILVNSNVLKDNQVIDGLVYNRDSDHGFILIRRSPTEGSPNQLRAGELAYSYLSDPSAGGGGNGGDRLYFGVGSDQSELATRIDIIGGKYFTDLLSHTHGSLVANTALIVDAAKSLDSLNVGSLSVTNFSADSATIDTLSVTTLNILDLFQNLRRILVPGEGIDLTLDSNSGTIRIEAEFATDSNAGIVLLDSDQFNTGGGGSSTVNILDGGTF